MKRKIVFLLVLMLCVVIGLCSFGCASETKKQQEEPEEGLQFALTADGAGYNVAGRGTVEGGVIEIPSLHEGLPVTGIAARAFDRDGELTSVSISEGVTAIGDGAFNNCTALTSVSMPTSLRSIGIGAFELCTALVSVDVPEGVTEIKEFAFGSCSALTDIGVPSSLERLGSEVHSASLCIGDAVFSGCKSLEYNEFDNALYLGNTANPYVLLMRAKSKDIESCTINENTKVIYEYAFQNCSALSGVVIPDSVKQIGYKAFSSSGVASVTIGSGVKEIRDSAFLSCKSLTGVVVPDGVEIVGDGAFGMCSALTTVSIGNGVREIGIMAFGDCAVLAKVTFGNGLELIGVSAFYLCPALTEAHFASTEGWRACLPSFSFDDVSADPIPLDPSALASSTTAAEYLRETYRDRYFVK